MDKQVYTVTEMQQILNIGREAAYRFVGDAYKNKDPFVVLKIGKSFRIPKESFDRWMRGENAMAADSNILH